MFMSANGERITGTVKFFNNTRGYGFIIPDGGGADVWVHKTVVKAARRARLEQGQRLTFVTLSHEKGMRAADLRFIAKVLP